MTLLIVLIGLALLSWAAQHFGTETMVGRDWQPAEVPPRRTPSRR